MTIYSRQIEALQFQLKTLARLPAMQASERYSHIDPELLDMMLEQAARFCEEELTPLAEHADLTGCKLENGKVSLASGTRAVYESWCELGFPTLGLPVEYDGLDFPKVMQLAVQELCDGSNMAFGMLAINLRCAALALIKHAEPELLQRWIPGLVSGEIASTIVISEPQAGSDVGRIRTSATPADNGLWHINGSKIWISYGDHDATDQILHLVLARIPDSEPGTRGLGLFLVPKLKDGTLELNGVSPSRLEHKMGLHGSPTCVLEFENAEGRLIGEAGRGIQSLFVMMNAMRMAVAVQGCAVANAATLHAIEYALERPQGGRADQSPIMIAEHQDVKRMLLEMTANSELLRALAIRAASYLDLADCDSDPEQAKRYQQLGELLLPVAKTLCAEQGFTIANQGIQVMGGYGYTSDYPMERLARDIRVASIYEGTSGIQALDFLKRKLLADKGALLTDLLNIIRTDVNAQETEHTAPALACLGELKVVVDSFLTNQDSNPLFCEAGAYALLQLVGLTVSSWNAHSLALACTDDTAYQNRLKAALQLNSHGVVASARLLREKALSGSLPYSFQKED